MGKKDPNDSLSKSYPIKLSQLTIMKILKVQMEHHEYLFICYECALHGFMGDWNATLKIMLLKIANIVYIL